MPLVFPPHTNDGHKCFPRRQSRDLIRAPKCRANPCANHQSFCSAAQIVKGPIRDWLDVCPFFACPFIAANMGLSSLALLLPSLNRASWPAMENVIAALNYRLRRNHIERVFDNGTKLGCFVLYRSAGMVQIPSGQFLCGSCARPHRVAVP